MDVENDTLGNESLLEVPGAIEEEVVTEGWTLACDHAHHESIKLEDAQTCSCKP